MKKIFTIIIGLLCALTAFAVSYASPYKGSMRVYTTSAMGNSSSMHTSGFAQTPVASMSSTSGYTSVVSGSAVGASRPATTMMAVSSSITTVASSIRGGVTTYNTTAATSTHKGGLRFTPDTPGEVEQEPPECGCHWVWDDEKGAWVCPICGCEWDGLSESCDCVGESGYCWCPLSDGWPVWLFMLALACAYAGYKSRGSLSSFQSKTAKN